MKSIIRVPKMGLLLALGSMLCGLAFGPTPAGALTRVKPHVVNPAVSRPNAAQPQISDEPGRCPTGFRRAVHDGRRVCLRCPSGLRWGRFRGRQTCFACPRGYRLKKLNGQDSCFRCPPRYNSANFNGRQACVSCPRGYRYSSHQGGNYCIGR